MKALAGVCGAIIGLLIVGGAGWFVFHPASAPARAASTQSAPPGLDESTSGAAPNPGQPIPAPTTREEQLKEELNQKRIPFYHYLNVNFGSVIDKLAVL